MPAANIALVGCGQWGRLILRDLRVLGADVVVVDSAVISREWALANGARLAVASVRELPVVAGLIVATPAATHADVLGALLDRRGPILVEKPFTTDVASAERLAAQPGGRLFVGHVWRYHPAIELLGSIARSGELGPVLGLHSIRANWTSPRTDVDSIWNLAPHDLTLAIEILGAIPEPRAAVAEVHEGRAVGLTAMLGRLPAQVFEVSNRYHDKRREVRLHCRDGVAVMKDPDASHIELVFGGAAAPNARVEKRACPGEPALRRELRAFLDHLSGGPPPKSDAAEGLAVVRTVAALRKLAGLEN